MTRRRIVPGANARPPQRGSAAAVTFSRLPRVLILSASVGAGHVRAAQAIEAAFAASAFPGEAWHLDVLATTNVAFRALYSKGYMELVNKASDLLGWLYDRTDIPWKSNRLQQAFEQANLAPFVRLLTDLRPDWALCTHFLPAGIIAWLRQERSLALPQAVVVTDFDVHAFWLLQHVEHYFVARDEARVHLAWAGVPADRISVTGIPIDPAFATPKDRGIAAPPWPGGGPSDAPPLRRRIRPGRRREDPGVGPRHAPPRPGGGRCREERRSARAWSAWRRPRPPPIASTSSASPPPWTS